MDDVINFFVGGKDASDFLNDDQFYKPADVPKANDQSVRNIDGRQKLSQGNLKKLEKIPQPI